MTPVHPSSTPHPVPRLIAWELTRACTLKCRHCRASADTSRSTAEFSTAECEKVLDNVAAFAKPIIILTGGEPLMRDDIFHLARHGSDLGLRMVLATCGALLSEAVCRRLIDAGIQRISLSIDGATARSHDAFRRVDGAFADAMTAAAHARRAGLEFQINTTVSQLNKDELPEIFNLAIELGAVSFHPFLLVPTGRGKELADYELSPVEYERVLKWVYDQRGTAPIGLKPTCAPHYYRILRQQEQQRGRRVTRQTHGLDAMTKGCLGAQGFAFISHVGNVQMCGFLQETAGNVRECHYDFKTIWFDSAFFNRIRALDGYHGRCGVCEYQSVCGGCRARAFAMTGDYLAEEPFCLYRPESMRNAR
ncbi:MAG: heme b synthase [Chitinivibrionales bacterium]|nr:heme b synthase [Chitinivibrionales bacterium]